MPMPANQLPFRITLFLDFTTQALGAGAGQWVEENLERVAAYDAWQRENFPAPGEQVDAADQDPPPDPGEPGQEELLADPDGAASGESGVGRD